MSTPTEPPIRSEHSGEYLRLARLWQRKQGHAWIFVAIDSAQLRDGLIARLDPRHTDARLLLPAQADPVQLVALLARAGAGALRAHLVLADAWQPDGLWWQQVNTLRERLADAFPHPVIWWLPDTCITQAARNAPDLWNWRETVLDFCEHLQPTQTAPVPGVAINFTGSADKEAILQRLRDIEAYLAAHGTQSAAAAHLLLEAARADERLGRWDASQHYAQQAHNAFAQLGNERMAVQAKGQIADILQARGRLDEALAIRQKEELPVYEQLGDIRSVAITKGQIADILEVRGRLDEALAIRQKEQLPVYEQLGDIRSAAITKGQIADILRAIYERDAAVAVLPTRPSGA